MANYQPFQMRATIRRPSKSGPRLNYARLFSALQWALFDRRFTRTRTKWADDRECDNRKRLWRARKAWKNG